MRGGDLGQFLNFWLKWVGPLNKMWKRKTWGIHQRRLLGHGFKPIESLISLLVTTLGIQSPSVASSLSLGDLSSTKSMSWVDIS